MPVPVALQACFVCCQYWCTAMFSPNVVGTANAFAGGWGNLGGGATQLVCPAVLETSKSRWAAQQLESANAPRRQADLSQSACRTHIAAVRGSVPSSNALAEPH
jgi:nitrate/nitrite transporter NarK